MNIDAALALAVPLAFDAEGCKLVSFLDIIGQRSVWTIGHGSTWIDGRPVTANMTCTRAEADQWAMQALTATAHAVYRIVTVPIDRFQLAALTSLAYNIGLSHFGLSDVLLALNDGLYTVAADRFLEYDHAGLQQIHHLETRRARERALFRTLMTNDVPRIPPAPTRL